MRLFPDFDDNLRQAMRQETELFFESIVREDRSVLDLDQGRLHLSSTNAWPSITAFLTFTAATSAASRWMRGVAAAGCCGTASILAVTSYATRTSPVIRGQWVLKNLVGAPPPPPPPNVPALEGQYRLPARFRCASGSKQHRANEACASCHDLMDPVGFALENFDAVGRWRESEAGKPIDASGGFLDGSEFVGVAGLEQALLDRPELFVRTLTEKLMTFALGRGVEYYDAPAIRKIVARRPRRRLSFLASSSWALSKARRFK